MKPLQIYDYLTKARHRIFDAVRALTPEQYQQDFATGLKTLGTTLTHTMIVEWAYTERMQGRELPPYETWPIQDENPPPFAVIEKTWREQEAATRRVLENISDWNRTFQYISKSREGKRTQITVSPAELFTQLAFHEVHHRAQVMSMLRELGHPVENVDFGYLMFDRKPLE